MTGDFWRELTYKMAVGHSILALSQSTPASAAGSCRRQPTVGGKVSVLWIWLLTLHMLISVTSGAPKYEYIKGDSRGKVQMGVKNEECDDGETDLAMDWHGDPKNYTCYHPDNKIKGSSRSSQLECTDLPKDYLPAHHCMGTPIEYDNPIPHHGNHRPIWPVFGEYKFVPPQRWLHNIEHGAVIMLYHPCTHHSLVEKLRKLVTGCIRKHVITPHNALSEDQPLALVAWGCRLLMSDVDEAEVIKFIRERGLNGPEGTYSKEGQYTYELITKATPPEGSDMDDSVLCPSHP